MDDTEENSKPTSNISGRIWILPIWMWLKATVSCKSAQNN